MEKHEINSVALLKLSLYLISLWILLFMLIVFTSNIPKEKVGQIISPELRSRFSYRASFNLLDLETKRRYLSFKYDKMINQIRETTNIEITQEKKENILNVDCDKYNNIRELNAALMNNISNELYTDIVSYFKHT